VGSGGTDGSNGVLVGGGVGGAVVAGGGDAVGGIVVVGGAAVGGIVVVGGAVEAAEGAAGGVDARVSAVGSRVAAALGTGEFADGAVAVGAVVDGAGPFVEVARGDAGAVPEGSGAGRRPAASRVRLNPARARATASEGPRRTYKVKDARPPWPRARSTCFPWSAPTR
jgi:hypothetical protein